MRRAISTRSAGKVTKSSKASKASKGERLASQIGGSIRGLEALSRRPKPHQRQQELAGLAAIGWNNECAARVSVVVAIGNSRISFVSTVIKEGSRIKSMIFDQCRAGGHYAPLPPHDRPSSSHHIGHARIRDTLGRLARAGGGAP
jgi:hypothetical protein